jgi:hypothetical protein
MAHAQAAAIAPQSHESRLGMKIGDDQEVARPSTNMLSK